MNIFRSYLPRKPISFFFIILSLCSFAKTQVLTSIDHLEFIPTYERVLKEGLSSRQKGDFSGAIARFEEALKFAQDEDNKKGQLTCLMNLGILFWNMGRPKESANLCAEALSLAQSLGLKNLQDECLDALKIYKAYYRGKELRSSGYYKESTAQFELAIKLARKIKSPEHELKCLRQLSLNYFQLDALREFFLLNDRAMKIAEKLNHRQEVGRCLNNIGLFYWRSNSYSKALSHIEEALVIAREFRNQEDESACLNNIGVIYRDIGSYDRSLQKLEESLYIDRSRQDINGISIDLNNIGETWRTKGEVTKNNENLLIAMKYYSESLKIATRIKNKRLEINGFNNIGLVYAMLGKFPSSLEYFQSAFKIADEVYDIGELIHICNNIGSTYFYLKDYQRAKIFFQRGLELSLKTEKKEILWEAYFGIGQCFEIEQQYSAALAYYKKAADIIDLIRSQLALDDYKAGFARDKLKVYESLVHLMFRLKAEESSPRYDEEIFQIIEKAKARAFLESLREVDDSSTEFQKEQDDISKKITLTISNLVNSVLTENQRKVLLQRLEKEEEEYISLLNRMKSEKSVKSGLNYYEMISIKKIQNQHLDQKTAILEFFLGEKESYVFLITKDDFMIKSLPRRADIEDSLRAYLKMLSTWPNRKFQGILAAKRLYQDLLGSFGDMFAPPLEHLIIVPDGILYYLPFETLVRNVKGKHSNLQYLIELYKISYAPSISSLVFLTRPRTEMRNPKSLLAIGNPDYSQSLSHQAGPNKTYGEALREIYLNSGFDFSSLPYAKREVLQISQYFPRGLIDIYLNSEASEEVIKKARLKDYQIIHFACHGFQDENSPIRSALVLSLDCDVEEDGFLQVREIYNLKLNADLVVLSACQTGRGKLENGEGILGLPRVFFYAGAKSTISTLWKISDKSTLDLMRNFYRYLVEGNDKAQALRLAKLKMIKSKFAHPFFWAGFILNGDYSSSSLE